jgi:hypothetical protein
MGSFSDDVDAAFSGAVLPAGVLEPQPMVRWCAMRGVCVEGTPEAG